MKSVSVREARKRLSTLLTAAERGEVVAITRRGKEVARIVPAEKDAPARFPDLTDFRKSITLRGEPASRTVINMRREERH